jgi:hypothetical protein
MRIINRKWSAGVGILCGAGGLLAAAGAAPAFAAAPGPNCSLLPAATIAAALGTGKLTGPTVHTVAFAISPENSCNYATSSNPHEVNVSVEAPVTAAQFKTSESPLTGYKYASYAGAGVPGYFYTVPNVKPSKIGIVVLKGKAQVTLFAVGVTLPKMEALMKKLVKAEK